MSAFIWILLFTVSTSDSLSIGVNQNVTKRETNANFFPDWVPFKNKHGADLGEFVDVAKSKPKKRLALPVNFKLKAVVETEGDDYFDKGLGGSDNDDNYDKKEWSDQHRSANVVDLKKPINHTDISDIDGIVNIITKPSNDPVLKLLKQRRKTSKQRDKIKRKNEEAKPKKESKESVEEEVIPKKESEKSAKEKVVPKKETEESAKEEIVPKKETEEIVIEVNDKKDTIEESESKNEEIKQEKSIEKSEEETEEDESKEEIKNDKENVQKIEENKEVQKKNEEKDDADDEETSADKEKEEAEKTEKQRENDEKKAKILSSVDELKERHAEEQRSLSEKIKEEELFEEELERELERTGTKRNDDDDKYAHPGSRWKKITEDFDEYEDQEGSLNDKYKINSFETTTTTISPKKTGKRKQKSNKIGTNGKLSVFRNPNLYTVNDEEDYSTTTSKPKKIRMRKPEKFSSKYSAQADEDKDNVRISLVPVDNDSKEGEPTLFFPKKRNSKRRFKIKTTTTPIPDTTADSSEEKSDLTDVTPTRTDYTETGPSASDAYSSASNTAPSAETGPDDTASSASDVSDTAQASTEKKGKKKKSDDYHRETGGEKEHHSEHDEVNEEHGKKAYEVVELCARFIRIATTILPADTTVKQQYFVLPCFASVDRIAGVHKDTKTNKGHHDKEKHLDKYDDHGGIDKHHHKEDNHYGSHHHEEHGKKHAKYEESGKHSKGHSTKGSHDIHKKEEYEKKVEFFEEDGDSDDEENEGGYHSNKEHSSGGHFKKGDLNAGYEGHSKGETGEFAKGGHVHVNKGHKASGGHDSHLKKGDGHHKKELQDKGKKWVYHHGHPAKTANLVIIDRRADAYMHGPRYFG